MSKIQPSNKRCVFLGDHSQTSFKVVCKALEINFRLKILALVLGGELEPKLNLCQWSLNLSVCKGLLCAFDYVS